MTIGANSKNIINSVMSDFQPKAVTDTKNYCAADFVISGKLYQIRYNHVCQKRTCTFRRHTVKSIRNLRVTKPTMGSSTLDPGQTYNQLVNLQVQSHHISTSNTDFERTLSWLVKIGRTRKIFFAWNVALRICERFSIVIKWKDHEIAVENTHTKKMATGTCTNIS